MTANYHIITDKQLNNNTMKSITVSLIILGTTIFLGCSQEKIIELPLTTQIGYGPFMSAVGGISPFSEDENNPWAKTYLKVVEGPTGLTDIKYGDIETNIHQSVYQDYLLGNITKERYEDLQKSWDWKPDTLSLSKAPIKTKIAFAYGKDSNGVTKMVVDANNNLDLSDDKAFIPFDMLSNASSNKDSIAQVHAIAVSVETFIHNKIVPITAPLFVVYHSQVNLFMCNFSQHATTQYKGENIAVCSGQFTNLSYENADITLLNADMKEDGKAKEENVILKNEYIEIKGEIYKNVGVNTNKNVLVLEKAVLPKTQLVSTQVGYKSYPFSGEEYNTKSPISLESLRGKYVLLDFWAVWCSPCIQEFPNLKELYAKVDTSKFEIVGIVGDSPEEALPEMINRHQITWPQILSDEVNKIKEKYGIHSYPTSLLLDTEGVIIAKNLRGEGLSDRVLKLIEK